MRELDPEEARAIIDPVLQLMISAVHRYDGYVVQSAGDGIFALFGAPVAREDHPQRAVHAAIAIREALGGVHSDRRDQLYLGILEQGAVLTIDEDYFLLTGGLERWLYRVARKHAGHQEAGWQFTMRQLYEKSGSPDRLANFAIAIRKIVKADELPGYALELNRNQEDDEIVYLIPRERLAFDDPRYKAARPVRRRLIQERFR
jgi:hypothetical protein